MHTTSKVDQNRTSKRRKTGGRAKGTPNASTKAIRAAISAADPITFLVEVMQGRVPSEQGNGHAGDDQNTPSATERIRAAEFLARRIAPEVKEQSIVFDL